MPEKITTAKTIAKADDSLFAAEEINFSLPTEKVEYATEDNTNILNEEIVLADTERVITDKNGHLEFSLEFPDEDKLKTKSKSSAAKNESESNEIEWDLPKIDSEMAPKLKQ